ncbi:SDR family oxidoreductase [Lentzea sp. BCCO 10_0856]|uniref:SDR family oxidoreductase n=1 Tax=Lentzea miocenica TaxID=3095431 RepID=A0ABU4T0N5_9PSEU|nr:SDR family oxidoreductase [Lentzea sp. BCCO 10_0856]MDX8031727.1 SDR family oxidoreductase [Lentzea sp. BCCO 10_0856]
MSWFENKIAVITGAGSGIGRALAIELSQRGARVALLDRDADGLEVTADQCDRGSVIARTVDVTDWAAMQQVAALVGEELGGVDALFSAAGIIHRGSLVESEISDIHSVMAVNWLGTVHTVKAFLPLVTASRGARVVTFSSAYGLMATSKYSAYNSSKFAVRGFSESLRQELTESGSDVSVTCVYPGGVRTPIVRNGLYAASEPRDAVVRKFEKSVARTEPREAALTVLRGVERRRARVLVGADARAVSALVHLLGGIYQDLVPAVTRLLGRRRSRQPRR